MLTVNQRQALYERLTGTGGWREPSHKEAEEIRKILLADMPQEEIPLKPILIWIGVMFVLYSFLLYHTGHHYGFQDALNLIN